MPKPLRDLAEIHYGKSPNGVLHEDGQIPIVGTGGVYGKSLRPLFQGPAVIVPRKGSLGNPQFIDQPFWAVDTTYAVLPKRDVDAQWLYYSLDRFDLTKLNEATGVPSISRDWLYRVPLGDVDYKTQRRIAEILSTVDKAIEQTEALIAKTQQVKAGLMHDLFDRGVTPDGKLRPPRDEAPQLYRELGSEHIPTTWDREILGKLTPDDSPICYGIVQPGEHKPDGIPVVAIHNLNTGFSTTLKCSAEIESAYERSRIRGGDVLLSIKGSIGRVDVTPVGFTGNISRDVARIRPRAGINPNYLRYALESAHLQTTLTRISVGTTRAELSIGRLKMVPVHIPSPPEQGEIADRLAIVDDKLKAERNVLIKLGQLRRGLMADLLTGCVPASEKPTSTSPKEASAHV